MSAIADFARDELRFPLWPGQAEVLDQFESGGYSTLVLQCGRRSGKSTVADIVAVYDASVRAHLQQYVRPGEERIAAIISPTQDQSERHIRRCGQLVRKSPKLRNLLVSETADTLRFSNGTAIKVYPASSRSLRGDAWSLCLLDELGFFLGGDGNAAGGEIVEAATPSLAQFGAGGWMIVLSTPGPTRTGAFFELGQQARSGQFPEMLFVQRTSQEMSPIMAGQAKLLAQKEAQNPESYRQEYLAEWVDGSSSYLAAEDVLACVQKGRTILRPVDKVRYVAAIDPAFTADNFSLAVGHKQGGQIVIDGVWVWHRRGYENTLSEVAAILKLYRCAEVRTDQHASEPIREGLARRQIHARYEPWTSETKSAAYTTLKVALNSRLIDLPDDKDLISELCGLQVKATATNFPRIAAAGAGKDDRAIVVASVAQTLSKHAELAVISVDGAWTSGGYEVTNPPTDADGDDMWPRSWLR